MLSLVDTAIEMLRRKRAELLKQRRGISAHRCHQPKAEINNMSRQAEYQSQIPQIETAEEVPSNMLTPAKPAAPFRYTRIRNLRGPMAKRIVPHPEKKYESVPAARLIAGEFFVESVASIDELACYHDTYGKQNPDVCLVYAVPTGGKISGPVVLKGEQECFPGSIARCREDLERREGEPGIAPVDYDPRKGPCWPPITPGEQPLSLHALDEALCNALPPLREVRRCLTSSSTSYISGLDGEVLKGPGGLRYLFGLEDGSKNRQLLEYLFQKLFAQGYGYIFITDSGRRLPRTLVDLKFRDPEQIDFSAHPIMDGPFVRNAPPRRRCIAKGIKQAHGFRGQIDHVRFSVFRGPARALEPVFENIIADSGFRRQHGEALQLAIEDVTGFSFTLGPRDQRIDALLCDFLRHPTPCAVTVQSP
jgi:hypothetical protein